MDQQSHEQQQKDFLSSFFPHDNGQPQGQHSMFQQYTQPSSPQMLQPPHGLSQSPTSQLTMSMLGNMMQIQGLESQAAVFSQSNAPYNPQAMLDQQFKLTQLQHLQQLQNQIFQQQIALISGQAGTTPGSPSGETQRDHTVPYTGLPTPGVIPGETGPSGEIRPQQPSTGYISPTILDNPYGMPTHNDYRDPADHFPSPIDHPMQHPPYGISSGSASAPEHVAFRPVSHHQQHSADLDLDISPLTSPWLGAHQQSYSSQNKRMAASSGDEGSGQPSRKKKSPAIRPANSQASSSQQPRKQFRGSGSTTSTPHLASSRSRKGSTAGDIVADTPSPVDLDLSMPPPAPPHQSGGTNLNNHSSTSSPSLPSNGGVSNSDMLSQREPPSPDFNPQLTPVTPASIMNLGRLGINGGLTPTRSQSISGKVDLKGKTTVKPKVVVDVTAGRTKSSTRRGTTGSVVSPNLKAILPAGTPTQQQHVDTLSSLPGPAVHGRKTSHKVAEQKRRDWLKSKYDDLRGLLPPIPLAGDDRHADAPVLPGALPPRGPPKAGGEGPNKSVSKLQLLICGNQYIRQLKARVERRDEEISRLRSEVRRLRGALNENGISYQQDLDGGEEYELDLDRDLDLGEAYSLLGSGVTGPDGEEEGEEDGDDYAG